MQIGIFSDIHDNLENLKLALDYFRFNKIETTVFCGDFCSPIPVRLMATFDTIQFHCIFGNNDGDRFTIETFTAKNARNIFIYGEYAELNFDERKIAVTHYPFYATALAECKKYDAVFSGHTHKSHVTFIENCCWVNPGELMAWLGNPSVAKYDTVSNQAHIIQLK